MIVGPPLNAVPAFVLFSMTRDFFSTKEFASIDGTQLHSSIVSLLFKRYLYIFYIFYIYILYIFLC